MKNTSAAYKLIKLVVKSFYPKMKVDGSENLPSEPVIIVSNHAQMNGPIACELFLPMNRYTWCISHMMHLKEVPDYAYEDFWSHKPKCVRWFYRLLSYMIAPLSVCVFNNAQTIPVYKDARIISTFKETIAKLEDGSSVVIFPEHDAPYSSIVNDFQDRFVDIARMYYRKTKKSLTFIPMYIAPELKKMVIGKGICFEPEAPMDFERERICGYLKKEITEIGRALPEHRVVTYSNIPKRKRPTNKQ